MRIGTVWLIVCCLASVAAGADRGARRTFVVEIYEASQASVVYVSGLQVAGHQRTPEEFFQPPAGGPAPETLGTGFLVHPGGYVLTNAHAVETMVAPHVKLSDGRGFPAEVLAVVHEQDLALLKIESDRPLVPVRLAAAGDVMIGEPVIVIANPHGLLATCTAGVVSAVGRATQPSGLPGVVLRDLIQTDAAINAGSSGGPWFNAAGEVMGITVSRKNDSDNIGFAVPAATIRRMLPAMLDAERRLGFTAGLSVGPEAPCRVAAVAPDGPAAIAGIQPGDLLLQWGDRPLADGLEWHLALAGSQVGQTAPLRIQRGEAFLELPMTLAARPKPDGAALLRRRLGLEAAPLTPETAQAMGLRLPRGVVIAQVDPAFYQQVETPPEPGDVLARIGWIRPRDLDEVGLLLDRMAPDQHLNAVLLRVRNGVNTRIDLHAAPKP